MRTSARTLVIIGGAVLTLLVLGGGNAGRLGAKDKAPQVSPNDPTVRLYNLLDSKYNGKLDDFYVLADVFNDPKNPGQHNSTFSASITARTGHLGNFNIHVRTVAQLTPEQLKTYTPKQIFDFAETDSGEVHQDRSGPLWQAG